MKVLIAKAVIVLTVFFGFPYIPMNYHVKVGHLMNVSPVNHMLREVVFFLADDNDTITFHIQSHGGLVTNFLYIANQIQTTEAKTISVNQGAALSAGALIAFMCDEIKSDPHSVYLFHRAGYNTSRGRVITPYTNPLAAVVRDIAREHIFPYLTKEEIARYEKGEDLFITGKEILSRKVDK